MIQLKKDFTDSEYQSLVNRVIAGDTSEILLVLNELYDNFLHNFNGFINIDAIYSACEGLDNATRLINLIDLLLMD